MNKVHLRILALFMLFMSLMSIANSVNDTNPSDNITKFNESYKNTSEVNFSEANINITKSSLVDETIQKEKDSIRIVKRNETNSSITFGYEGVEIKQPIYRIESERIRYGVGEEITISRKFIDEKNTIIEVLDATRRIIRTNYSIIELEEKEATPQETQKPLIIEEIIIENRTENLTVEVNKSSIKKIIINQTSKQYRLDREKELSLDLEGLVKEVIEEVPEEIIHVGSKLLNSRGVVVDKNITRINNSININLNESLESGSYTLVSSLYYKNKSHVHSIPILVNAVKLSRAGIKIFNETYKEPIADLRSSKNTTVTVRETILNDTSTIIIPDEGVIKQLVVNAENLSIIDKDYIGLDTNITNLSRPGEEPFKQAFAIDPEQSNITTIDITATAQGDELYKCVDWNFTTQTCFGEWKFVQFITPGENYTVTIDPVDPAFGEQSSFLKMDWGLINNVGDTWVEVNLEQTYNRPVIIATPMYISVGVPTITRITNITQTSFELRLQDTGGGTATTRDVSYFVIEEGIWTLPSGSTVEAFTYTSTQTDSSSDWTPVQQFPSTTFSNPVVLGQVMSYNDSEWSVFWSSDGTQDGDPTPTQIYTGKHVGQDPSTTRTDEEIGVIIFEQNSGNINGIEYAAYKSSDSIQGITNSPPYGVNHPITFSSTPTVGLASTNGMDGGNGGWPVFYNGITSTQANLGYDEFDSGERQHTTEPAGLLIFASPGNYTGNNPPSFTTPNFNASIIEPTEEILFSVNVTDPDDNLSMSFTQATFRYPNGSTFDVNITQTTIGTPTQTEDLETNTQAFTGKVIPRIGETGIISNVSDWQVVQLSKTYSDPAVFVFGLNKSDRSPAVEEAIAIVTNVSSTAFSVAVINASNLFIEDDVGFVVMEKGVWNISNTLVQVGDWEYSGTSFVQRNFSQPFGSTPTVYIQAQDNSDNWYTGRYTAGTLGTNSIEIQYENAFNAFSEVITVSYIAFEQGINNGLFAGDLETSIGDDPGSGTFRTVNFPQNFAGPVFMGIVSEGGGDPTTLGTGSLTENSVGIRPTEETLSDAEQNHAVNDVLWMVFNESLNLENDTPTINADVSIGSKTYNNIDSSDLNFISSVTVTVNLDETNNTASNILANSDPAIEIELGTITGYQSIGTLTGSGNKSRTGSSQTITSDWALDSAVRDVKISAVNIDYINETTYDSISWSDVQVSIQNGNRTVEWTYIFSDTDTIGKYNVTRLETTDGALINITNYTTIGFEVRDQTPPTITDIYNVTIGDTQTLEADFDAIDYSNIYSWSVNNSLFNINISGTLINTTNLIVGVYNLNINVNDTYNNSIFETIFVNVTNSPDITPPEFVPTLNLTTQPYGLGWSYDVNATDDRGIISAFWINDTTFIVNTETGEITPNGIIPIGEYILNISVNDSSNNINSSTLHINITDQTGPIFNLASQLVIEYNQEFAQQLNITDDVEVFSVETNDTNFTINNSGFIRNASLLARGTYNISLIANDTSNNTNTTNITIIVQDTTPPSQIGELSSPEQGFGWIYWNWTLPPDEDFNTLIIYLDELFIINTTSTSINITELDPSTNYTITIQTADQDNNINTTNSTNTSSTNINTPPQIQAYAPLNLSASLDLTRNLNFSASDAEQSTFCLKVVGSQSPPTSTEHILYRDCNYNNNTNITYNWSRPVLENISSSEVLWHFDNNSDFGENDTTVHDFAGGIDHGLTCSGTTCPTFTMNGAIGGAFNYDSTNNQGWSITDQFFNDAFSVRSYQLWFKADSTTGTKYIYEEGGTTNGFAFKIQDDEIIAAARDNFIQFNVSTSFSDTSEWHFLVVQYDTGNLSLYLDGNLVDSVDTSANFNSISTHSDEGFIGSTTGGGAFGSETGSFDGQIDEFRITTTALSSEEIYNLSQFTINTTYYWNIIARDGFGTNKSELQFFVEAPSADISLLNITYENSIEGENTTIIAFVNNTGTTTENNVLIEFIVNNTNSINRTIPTINPGQILSVNISYLFELGLTPLNITVDANSQITEIDENDNNINTNISTSSHQLYYGTLDLERVLGNNESQSIFSWFESNATGIIYAIDSDASVNFANVYALGKNTSGENSTLDFSEADTALELTGRFDSITNYFGLNENTSRQTRNFSVGGFNITNVPVRNSTTTDNFQTGIMWDATSDTTGEYDENETLIFIANVEDNLEGLYGTYDYELLVPTTLEETEGMGSSLEIYIELE